jgi:hypothetical protein
VNDELEKLWKEAVVVTSSSVRKRATDVTHGKPRAVKTDPCSEQERIIFIAVVVVVVVVVVVKQSRYTPWRRLRGRGGIAPTHSRPRH